MSVESSHGLRNLNARTEKKDHLHHHLQTLDTFIFLQIAALYYCDNLTILLILRTVSQIFYVQPRPPQISAPAPFPPILAINVVCFLTHILQSRPEATDRSARGYIHGGVLIDFEGEHGPISKWRLSTLDIIIFGLQLLMLLVGQAKEKLEEKPSDESTIRQDIEAEEEGIRRSQEDARPGDDENGIELQSLLPSGETMSDKSEKESQVHDFVADINLKRDLKGLMHKTNAAASSPSAAAEQAASISTILSDLAAARGRPGQ